MTGSRLFSVVNAVVAALFLTSAALQFNDPDPLRWMALYGAAAAACVVARRLRHGAWFAAAVGLVALAWAAALSPILPALRLTELTRSMKAENPTIELGRELLGLLVVGAWMVALAIVAWRSTRGTPGARRS